MHRPLVMAVLALASAGAEPTRAEPLTERIRAGLVSVRVTFDRDSDASSIELVTRHQSQVVPVPVGPRWLGRCLPDRFQLRAWLKQHPRHPQRALWRRALQRHSYEALVFLATTGKDTVPQCTDEEALSMRHTDVHPLYGRYRNSVMAANGVVKREGLRNASSALPPRYPVTICPMLD